MGTSTQVLGTELQITDSLSLGKAEYIVIETIPRIPGQGDLVPFIYTFNLLLFLQPLCELKLIIFFTLYRREARMPERLRDSPKATVLVKSEMDKKTSVLFYCRWKFLLE